jgi:hypothetical protein
MSTLGDDLPKEIARVRDVVLPAYLECGPGGQFGVLMIRKALNEASRAMIEGDTIAMIRVYQELKGWHE